MMESSPLPKKLEESLQIAIASHGDDQAIEPPRATINPESSLLPPSSVQHCVIDGKGSSWHQSPIWTLPKCHEKGRRSSDNLPILDFDILCATVAMQSEPLSIEIHRSAPEIGVQRMWEGGVLNCFDDSEIALQTICFPCLTFGKNMQRAGLGSCFGKGGVYFLLAASAVINYTLFLFSFGHLFLYLAFALLISVAAYAGHFRIQIRRRFNIKSDYKDGIISSIDDYSNHLLCGCCTLCQEARTLEMNNVQDGNWHGRGDTKWVGSYSLCESEYAQPSERKQPVVITVSSDCETQDSTDHAWNQKQDSSEPFITHCDLPK